MEIYEWIESILWRSSQSSLLGTAGLHLETSLIFVVGVVAGVVGTESSCCRARCLNDDHNDQRYPNNPIYQISRN